MCLLKYGSSMFIFLILIAMGSTTSLLVMKSLLYTNAIMQERYNYEYRASAAMALLAYGVSWAQEQLCEGKEISAKTWSGKWWPDTGEWTGTLTINQDTNTVLVKATLKDSITNSISCIDSFIINL